MIMYAYVRQTLVMTFHAVAVAALIPAALCQTMTTGEITGTVTDPADKVVRAATVQLRSVDTGESRDVQSNDSGVYRFVFVEPGTYEISGRSEGLRSDAGKLILAVGQVQSLDLHLKLEQPKSFVLVTDGAPLLNTDNAHLVYTLSTEQLDLLPLPGGDLASVAYSAPGVVLNNKPNGTGNFVLQGVGSVSNLFTVNGADAMDPYTNSQSFGVSGMLLGVNEVKEASIVQNGFEGQYGRQAGAQVNYVTKSGANNFHGNLLYSYNGTQLNANDFFANKYGTPRALAISNQYAASLGGRIVRNKLFFFVDTEGLRYKLPTPNHVAAIPSPELENYALETIQSSQVPLYQKMFSLYNNAPGHNRAVPVTNSSGIFQDSKLGCGQLVGTPTGTGGEFGVDVSCTQAWETNSSALRTEWLLSGRVDYNLSANQRMFFRFKTDHGSYPFFTSDVNAAFNGGLQGLDYQGQVSYTLVITPHLVNNVIGSVAYNTYVKAVADLTAALKTFPIRINVKDGGASGSGIASIGGSSQYPMGRRAGQFQLVDDISYNAGRHSFKAGVNYRYNPIEDLEFAGSTQIGRYNIGGLDVFASGRLSGNSAYVQFFSANPTLHVRLYNLGAYVQDQWAVTSRLKITAAVRLDRTGNPYCISGCFSRFVAPFPELNKALSIPYNQSIQTGLTSAFYDIESVVPEPRLSLVYVPQWSKATVIRGGIGLFYDLYAAAFAGYLGGNPPEVFQSGLIKTGLINAGGPGSAAAIAAASANKFQAEFSGGATLPQLQQAVAPASFVSPSFYSMPSKTLAPKSLQWTLEVQRQLGRDDVFTVRYTGNHGYDLFTVNQNLNASADPASYPNGFAGLPTATPDPRFSLVTQYINSGYSNYHSLLANFRHTFQSGLQGRISYTWSHALDTVSNGGLMGFGLGSLAGQINPASLGSLNYSNADYDVRHNLTGDLIWEMPFHFHGRLANTLLTGWSAGTRLNAHSGTPFSVTNGDVGGLSGFSGTVLADLLDPNIRTVCGRSAIDTPCFTANQFVPSNAQTNFGNLPRNSFRGPGYFNLDASLFKTVLVRESVRLMLGASAFNVLNHPNFADPGSDISASDLGKITSTVVNPSGPLGSDQPSLSGRVMVAIGKFMF
jgi:hypothetical protein